jgi:hypothetical protein
MVAGELLIAKNFDGKSDLVALPIINYPFKNYPLKMQRSF